MSESQPETVTISTDDAASILDYLDEAGHGMSEYGAPSSAFDDLKALKRRLYFLVYGEAMAPDPEPSPVSEVDQALTSIAIGYVHHDYVARRIFGD